VEKLRRVRIGPLELGALRPGQFRYLTLEEMRKLKRAVHTASREPSREPRAKEAV